MEQRITFITLGVADLTASIDFYENKLGWKRDAMSTEAIIFFKLNGLPRLMLPVVDLKALPWLITSGANRKSTP
jgi:catechol 2,3-dioxygenase-like lactoylglutathione lyase family enzyme